MGYYTPYLPEGVWPRGRRWTLRPVPRCVYQCGKRVSAEGLRCVSCAQKDRAMREGRSPNK